MYTQWTSTCILIILNVYKKKKNPIQFSNLKKLQPLHCPYNIILCVVCIALRTRARTIPQMSGYVIPNTMFIPDDFSMRFSYAATSTYKTSSRRTFSAPSSSSSSTCRPNNYTYRLQQSILSYVMLLCLWTTQTTSASSSYNNRRITISLLLEFWS